MILKTLEVSTTSITLDDFGAITIGPHPSSLKLEEDYGLLLEEVLTSDELKAHVVSGRLQLEVDNTVVPVSDFGVRKVIEPKDSIEVVAEGSGTTLTKNYSTTSTTGTEFEFDVTRINSVYGYFTVDFTTNTITINKTGRYRVSYNLGHTSTGQRASLESFITVNGVDIGTIRPRSYVRNVSGHTTDNIIDEDLINLNKDDVIQLRARRAEGSSITQAINMIRGSHLTLEWISANGI